MNKGKVDVLLGLQWGDEGKGKVVDVLTPKYDIIARFQGGPNAGHTLEFEGQKYVLRSIPSGIFQGGKVNIIGNGVVLAPDLFMDEQRHWRQVVMNCVHAFTSRARLISSCQPIVCSTLPTRLPRVRARWVRRERV